MTEKRFTSNCKLGLFDGEESKIKCLLDNGEFKSRLNVYWIMENLNLLMNGFLY